MSSWIFAADDPGVENTIKHINYIQYYQQKQNSF